MTKELIARLRENHTTWRDTISRCEEAADAIEALTARVAELNKVVTALKGDLTQRTTDLMLATAELAAALAQEPVAHRYKFTHPISGEPVWRDSSPTWNGQCVQEVQPLFAAPVPPVREPLTEDEIFNALGGDESDMREVKADPESWAVIVEMARKLEAAIKEQK